jgi:hypothetical protein
MYHLCCMLLLFSTLFVRTSIVLLEAVPASAPVSVLHLRGPASPPPQAANLHVSTALSLKLRPMTVSLVGAATPPAPELYAGHALSTCKS